MHQRSLKHQSITLRRAMDGLRKCICVANAGGRRRTPQTPYREESFMTCFSASYANQDGASCIRGRFSRDLILLRLEFVFHGSSGSKFPTACHLKTEWASHPLSQTDATPSRATSLLIPLCRWWMKECWDASRRACLQSLTTIGLTRYARDVKHLAMRVAQAGPGHARRENAILLHLVEQSLIADLELLCGRFAIPPGRDQNAFNDLWLCAFLQILHH
jgi:hypothetical protein